MTDETPQRILLAGAEILAPALVPHGFVFNLEAHGKGSGGWFASGAYRRANRSLELHFRGSLGLVTYHIDQASLDHEAYMRLLGAYATNQYPDFPREPLESFHHLAIDIRNHCQDFVSGDGKEFQSMAAAFAENSKMFRGIP